MHRMNAILLDWQSKHTAHVCVATSHCLIIMPCNFRTLSMYENYMAQSIQSAEKTSALLKWQFILDLKFVAKSAWDT